MGKLIKRQHLSENQYKRANRVMCVILIISYLVYIIVEVMNAKSGMNQAATTRCIIYGAAGLVDILLLLTLSRKKICMTSMAVTYLAAFAVLIFGNGVVVLAMVFPVLIGFMIYLNALLVGLGWFSALIIGVLKCIAVSGDSVLFNYGILILAGYVVGAVGSNVAINLLINFSKEDRAVIEKEAAHRAEVAAAVAKIVENLDRTFTEMMAGLNTLNTAMRSADEAVAGIASSSEETAKAINNQAGMTTHIQESLDHTNELSTEATETAERLTTVVADGKDLADHLLEQSGIVDKDIGKVSDMMTRLSANVQKVSGFTNTITGISSQTNLLAVNATIESARAGEAGKGFSVIAGNVRSLAEGTEGSAKQIENIIRELTSINREMNEAILASSTNIAEQRKQVNQVYESFSSVQTGILQLTEAIETMNDNVKSVLEANGEIVESIRLISGASEEVSAGTQVCKNTTDTAFENLGRFSKKVDGAFEQLQNLKETAEP